VEWPDEGDEAAFLSEATARGEAPPAPPTRGDAPVLGDRLPALDELVARVPEGARDLLDELFRAKFTEVRRFPPAPGGA
jgi:hypothetical protein